MCVPQRVVTNDDLAQMLDTSDEWIRSRTGIGERRLAGEGETTAQMATEAARAALQVADADPRDVDLVIVATATPDHPMPSTACQVQIGIGAIHAGAFDLNAGCSGFVYALVMGHQAIASGEHNLVMVIGADTLSRTLDWQDRSTCVLFGDGAGAVLLRASEGPAGILATVLGADGAGADLLMIPAGGSAQPITAEALAAKDNCLRMDGPQVFRFASRAVPEAIRDVTKRAGLRLDELAWIIPHQANERIIEAAAKRLGVPPERFYLNLDRYGNTSAASVPIALCEAVAQGHVQHGQNLALVGFGAGLTWAAVALRWSLEAEERPVPMLHSWLRKVLYSWASLRTRVNQWRHRSLVWVMRQMRGQR
jgi:3-oxoacyl-[acyl-carrier-protein] synthase-3